MFILQKKTLIQIIRYVLYAVLDASFSSGTGPRERSEEQHKRLGRTEIHGRTRERSREAIYLSCLSIFEYFRRSQPKLIPSGEGQMVHPIKDLDEKTKVSWSLMYGIEFPKCSNQKDKSSLSK